MKKILLLVLVFVFTASIFSSCSKKKGDSLVGTTWEMSMIDDDGNEVVYQLYFEKNGIVKYTEMLGGGPSITINGTYVYNKPNLTITMTVPGSGGSGSSQQTVLFKVSGNQMVGTIEGENIILHKK